MKSSELFENVSLKAFWDLMAEFSTGLETTFPDCAETKDWGLYMRNVVQDNAALKKENVRKWSDGVLSPLKKARYAKAVQSLTGHPPTVYHAIHYHDIDVLEHSFEALQPLCLGEKLKSDAMDEEARSVFWKYMREMTKHALDYTSTAAPRVPTSEEIAADIQRRKNGGGHAAHGPVLQQGLKEVWQLLCEARGNAPDVSDVHARLSSAMGKSMEDGETIGDRCRKREAAAFAALAAELPELRGAETVTEQQWSLLDKALGLAAMENAIPGSMMRGIESVANQLVKDLLPARPTCPPSTSIHGQQVLSEIAKRTSPPRASRQDPPRPPRSSSLEHVGDRVVVLDEARVPRMFSYGRTRRTHRVLPLDAPPLLLTVQVARAPHAVQRDGHVVR